MLTSRLMEFIETHARSLIGETLQDIQTNERTPSFHRMPAAELEQRVAALYLNLRKWIGNPEDDDVRKEYEEWGRKRFRQGVPLSEIIYFVILAKAHLRRFIREHGLVAFAGERVTPDELVPVQLYGIQELNYMVGEFFDRALYHLARGYEEASKTGRAAA
jgi:RsbRD-like negative regulator of sigma factor